MSANLAEAIDRAKYLLQYTRNAAMATVNADGSPHNTPFFFIHDAKLEYIYWGSHPTSLHSQNAERTGQIFVVLYEADAGGGLYIKAAEAKPLAGDELVKALAIHNSLRAKEQKQPLDIAYYSGKNPQRMYSAQPVTFYVNYGERDASGKIIKDVRHEVSLGDLVS